MSIRAHCECLTRMLLAWEGNVHARLGYFPHNFREACREHVAAYLQELESELSNDLQVVQQSLRVIRTDMPDEGRVDFFTPLTKENFPACSTGHAQAPLAMHGAKLGIPPPFITFNSSSEKSDRLQQEHSSPSGLL